MKSIELFAGAGGLAMGVASAGFSHELVIERDKYCCDTIVQNQRRGFHLVKSWKLYANDVRRCDFTQFSSSIDLVCGGPPCQPFSIGGRHRAESDDRDMFPQAVRAIREAKPKAFIFENVKGLNRAAFTNYREYIKLQMKYPDVKPRKAEDWADHLKRLEQHETSGGERGIHYRVIVEVLNAANYGIPQKRERIFFVGFRSDLSVKWSFPKATHSFGALAWAQTKGDYWDRHGISARKRNIADKLLAKARRLSEAPEELPWVTVRDAISDLPDPALKSSKSNEFLNHIYQPGARSYVGHTGSPLDEPAKTLKAGVHGVPGGENMLLKPNGDVRYFTVRESARLQTFSDDYEFYGSWSEAIRQLGNAVPVALAQLLAQDVAAKIKGAGAGQ